MLLRLRLNSKKTRATGVMSNVGIGVVMESENPLIVDLERSEKERFRHQAITSHIEGIEGIYANSNITINSAHSLFGILSDAKALAAEWERGNFETDMMNLFSALHVQRIYTGIASLVGETNRAKYLKDLLNGSLNFFDRELSHAKGIFWEMEAFTKIKKVIPATCLEEPDIVVTIGERSIAVPCKKIFSDKGVPKVLSNAVAQIKRGHEFGIVALNIDDQISGGVVLNASTFKEAAEKLHSRNLEFFARHERHLLKYLTASRIVAVIASTSVVADIHDETPKFNNFSQWTIWTIPDLKQEHKNAIDEFRQKVIG